MEYYIGSVLFVVGIFVTFVRVDLAPTMWLAIAIFHGLWSIANAITRLK